MMPSQGWPTTRPTTKAALSARYALVAALYKQQLGVLIARMREDLGLTQKQLAERAHVAEAQTVSRWERGERVPQDLEAVAAALETTAADMLRQLEPLGQRQRKAMNADGGRSQLDRIEARLDQASDRDQRYESLIERQNGLLVEQSELLERLVEVLERIEAAIDRDDEAAKRRDDESAARLYAATIEAVQMLRAAPETPGSGRRERAPSGKSRA